MQPHLFHQPRSINNQPNKRQPDGQSTTSPILLPGIVTTMAAALTTLFVPLNIWFSVVNRAVQEPYLVGSSPSLGRCSISHTSRRTSSFTSARPNTTAMATSIFGTPRLPHLLDFTFSPTSSSLSLDVALDLYERSMRHALSSCY